MCNDGSTDDSLQILQEYENKFSCITVISQENAGHAAARNTGFDNTKGKYVWFVDSDDVIDWNCFGIIYDLFDKYSLDGLCVEYMPVPSAYDGDTHKKGVDGVKILKKQSHYSCSGIRLFSADLLRSNNIHWDDRL
ncbi:MAG: glycosyltransferase, partial [Clostridia bacterium]|nr:glycosyltransferase [Clostridia bacterium]